MSSADGHLSRAEREHPRDDPTLARAPVSVVARHRILGETVRIESNDGRITDCVRVTCGPRLPEAAGAADADIVVRVLTHDVAEDAGFVPRQPLIRRQRNVFSITGSRASAVAGDARTGFAFGFVSDFAASQTAFLREGIVMGAVLCTLAPRFLTVVHAACVVRDGTALLLRGDSGAGKTTLTYAALRRGYALLAEDATYIQCSQPTSKPLAPDELRLVGVPWSMNLLSGARDLFPELAGEPVLERLSGEWKLCVNIVARFPGQTQEAAALGPTVFVQRGQGGAARLHELPRDAALARLDATAIVDERLVAREHGLWDAFLARPVYLLETGTDPHANAAMLDEIVRMS